MENKQKDSKWAKFFLVRDTIPKASYIMHGIAGLFMFYIIYSLLGSEDMTLEPWLVYLSAAFFAVCGLYFIAGAVYALKNGIYKEHNEV